jgi:peptidoglycan/LPS O-acetylase OafA/YrhL
MMSLLLSNPNTADTDPARSLKLASGHLPALDGLRGTAILMILVHHFISMNHTSGRTAAAIGGIAQSLWCGVDLFFVLSGFLVTRVLLNAPRDQRFFWNFYIRRALRIFPLYYSVILVALVVTVAGFAPKSIGLPQSPKTYIPLVLYYANFYTLSARWPALGSLFVFWSLAVEEHFYFVWPFAVFASRPRGLIWICVTVIVAAAAVRIAMLRVGAPPIAVYCVTFCRMDALALGALVCVLMETGLNRQLWSKWGHIILITSLAAAVGICRATGQLKLDSTNPIVQRFGYDVVAAFMAGLLIVAVAASDSHPLVRLFRSVALRQLGKYSYGIYVFHTMALEWVITHFSAAPGAGRWIFLAMGLTRPVVGVAASLTAAWLSYHLLERHMLRLKEVFAPGSRQRAPSDLLSARNATARNGG